MGRERKIEGEEPPRNTRATNRREMREGVRTKQAEISFVRDTGKMWNGASTAIKEAPTKGRTKRLLRNYCHLREGHQREVASKKPRGRKKRKGDRTLK